MTPEEETTVEAVTRKLTGKRFEAQCRSNDPLDKFPWIVWDYEMRRVATGCRDEAEANFYANAYNLDPTFPF